MCITKYQNYGAKKAIKSKARLCLITTFLEPYHYSIDNLGFPDSSVGKESTRNAGDPGLIPGLERSTVEGIGYPLQYSWASLVAQLVRNLPTMQETWVQSWGWEDPWRRERLPTLFWPGKFMDCVVHGVGKSRTQLSNFHFHFY